MSVEFRGLDSLKSKLRSVGPIIKKAAEGATVEIVEEIKGRAVSKVQSSVKYSEGGSANYIKDEVVFDNNDNVIGRVFTDKDALIFREFGTGPVGESSPKNLPQGVNPVYTTKRWFIHVSMVDLDLEAIYGIPRIKIGDAEFYMTRGQPARPWLYPSLLEVEDLVLPIYQEHLGKELKRLGK